jgi:hypothetical protein
VIEGAGKGRPHTQVEGSCSRAAGVLRSVCLLRLPVCVQQLTARLSHTHMYAALCCCCRCCCCFRGEAYRLVAYYLALQHHKPPPAKRRALTFDQHLLSSISTASKLTGGSWTGIAASCEAFVGAKLAGGLQAHPPRCSDIVWGAAGMAAAVLALGVLAAAAKTLPVVGPLHQTGRQTPPTDVRQSAALSPSCLHNNVCFSGQPVLVGRAGKL